MPTGRSAIGLDSFDIETEAMQGPANETAAGQLVLDTRMHLDAACQRKHPAEILALGPSCAFHRRSSNANSLFGRNSAGSPEIRATFQRDILARHF